MGGFSIWHWLLVLAIVVIIFGTKKLKTIGKDVGEAMKSFKDAVTEDKDKLESHEHNKTEEKITDKS